MRPALNTRLEYVHAGGATYEHLEGFSDNLFLGLLWNHGATCTVTISQPWSDAAVRSIFLLNPSVTLELIPILLMTSKSGDIVTSIQESPEPTMAEIMQGMCLLFLQWEGWL